MSLSIVFGHADDGEAVLVQAVDDAHRALAADADDGVEAVPVVGLADALETVLVGEGLVAARAEDRAAEGQDAAAPVDVEDLVVVVHDPAPRVAEADDGAVVRDLGGAGGAPDDGVEAGTVPAPGEDADAHDLTFVRLGMKKTSRRRWRDGVSLATDRVRRQGSVHGPVAPVDTASTVRV